MQDKQNVIECKTTGGSTLQDKLKGINNVRAGLCRRVRQADMMGGDVCVEWQVWRVCVMWRSIWRGCLPTSCNRYHFFIHIPAISIFQHYQLLVVATYIDLSIYLSISCRHIVISYWWSRDSHSTPLIIFCVSVCCPCVSGAIPAA